MAIACKKKPTQVSDFNGIDLDKSVTNANSGSNLTPTPDATIDSTDDTLNAFEGEYKSVEQFRDGGDSSPRTFYYKMELKKVDGNKWQLIWKIGDFATSAGSYGGGYEQLGQPLRRDKAHDSGNKKAFSDNSYVHFATFDGNNLTLMPDKWGIHIVFKKIK